MPPGETDCLIFLGSELEEGKEKSSRLLGVSGEVTVFTPTIDNAGLFYFCHSGEYILACISLMTNKIEYFSNIIGHLNTYCLV